MGQQCERPACAEAASVGYGFDRDRGMAWLVPLGEGDAEQGRLCRRHADSMVVPRGWWLEDRRTEEQLFGPQDTARQRRRWRSRRAVEGSRPALIGSSAEPDGVATSPEEPVAAASLELVQAEAEDQSEPALVPDEPAAVPQPWVPAFVAGDDLDGVLNATSPLLARAFGQVKGSGTSRPAPDVTMPRLESRGIWWSADRTGIPRVSRCSSSPPRP